MIRRILRRGILYALSIVVLLSLLSSSSVTVDALQCRTSKFSNDYTLTGYGASDMIDIAFAQLGKTGKQLGYTEEWCCNFISDCAILAGQTEAIPAESYCYGLYSNIIAAGGKKTTSSPQPGDICFINWDGGRSMQHVELVYKVENGMVYTIGGNSGGASNLYTRSVFAHDPLLSRFIVTIVRPNYQVLDTSYVTQCEKYDTYCTIRVSTDAADLMSQPCTLDTDAEAEVVSTAATGSEFTATAVYKNTLGQLWYAVGSSGETVYVYAGDTEFVCGIEEGITISGVDEPKSIDEGRSFSVKGTVKSKHLTLTSVYAYVRNGEEIVTGTEEKVKNASYSLRYSALDKGMKFGALEPGEYCYEIGASISGYYVDENQTLQKYTLTVVLHSSSFTVEEHVCQWTLKGYTSDHPHYARYQCSGCGDTKKETDKTTQAEECKICNPEPEYQAPVPLPEENKLSETLCIHPFFTSCSFCSHDHD